MEGLGGTHGPVSVGPTLSQDNYFWLWQIVISRMCGADLHIRPYPCESTGSRPLSPRQTHESQISSWVGDDQRIPGVVCSFWIFHLSLPWSTFYPFGNPALRPGVDGLSRGYSNGRLFNEASTYLPQARLHQPSWGTSLFYFSNTFCPPYHGPRAPVKTALRALCAFDPDNSS